MDDCLRYAEKRLDEAIRNNEEFAIITYWRGYADGARRMMEKCGGADAETKAETEEAEQAKSE